MGTKLRRVRLDERWRGGALGQRRGAALLYAVFAAFAAASMVSILLTMSLSADRASGVHKGGVQARFLTEGAIEVAKRDLAAAVANWQPIPAVGNVTIDGRALTYQVTPTGFVSIDTDPAGIQSVLNGYQLSSSTALDRGGDVSNQMVHTRATPIFQFAVFYTDDLEINPGPDMTLGGRVHTNSDMFLNSGGTLTMNTNYVRAAGEIFRHRKDDPTVSKGTVDIRQWVLDPFDPGEPVSYFEMSSASQMAAMGVPSASGYDSAFVDAFDANGDGFIDLPPDEWLPWGAGALEYWSEPEGYAGTGNTVMSSVHGVGQAHVPSISSIQMYEPDQGGSHYLEPSTGTYLPAVAGQGTHSPGYYHSQADLSIVTFEDGSFQALSSDGTDVTSTLLSSGAVSGDTLYDARQAGGGSGDVAVTQIDLGALASTGLWPSNGLVYAAHYGAGPGTQAKGIKLVNGADLAGPLTVVSENSMYVQGDFNTGNKKGSAVIADAVNLLSNAWDDTKSSGSGLPGASETTYNMAIITGNTQTSQGSYNGGLENLPRFHESWSGVKCNITGSFVNIWNSQYANAPWKYGGNRYKAPQRAWAYDTDFNNVANLPPFTPMAVTVEEVAVW